MRNKLVEIYGAGILAFTVIVGFGTLLIKFLALVGEGFLHEDAFGAGAIVFPVQDRRSFWRLRATEPASGPDRPAVAAPASTGGFRQRNVCSAHSPVRPDGSNTRVMIRCQKRPPAKRETSSP